MITFWFYVPPLQLAAAWSGPQSDCLPTVPLEGFVRAVAAAKTPKPQASVRCSTLGRTAAPEGRQQLSFILLHLHFKLRVVFARFGLPWLITCLPSFIRWLPLVASLGEYMLLGFAILTRVLTQPGSVPSASGQLLCRTWPSRQGCGLYLLWYDAFCTLLAIRTPDAKDNQHVVCGRA
jgi:hypothetical protein